MKRLNVENYFLRFSFPCTYVIRQRGDIDDKTFKKLENAALKGIKVDRKLLENTYKKAFERLKQVAKDMGKNDCWDKEVIKEYFIKRHNAIIERKEGSYATAPETLRELCKVLKAEVIEKKKDFFKVKYGKGKTRVVSSVFVPKAEVGDKVIIHYGYALGKEA